MNLKPILLLVVLGTLLLQLRNCRYGAEHQEVDPRHQQAHLIAVEAQKLLQERDTEGALALYEQARALMEDASVRADRGDSIYINYGFVLNDIGVIRLAWAIYGKNPPADLEEVDLARIDRDQLEQARESLEGAAAFYERWFAHNPKEFERYAKALSETYANLGTTYKYLDRKTDALESLERSLQFNPRNKTAKHSFELFGVDPKPYVDRGDEFWQENKKSRLL